MKVVDYVMCSVVACVMSFHMGFNSRIWTNCRFDSFWRSQKLFKLFFFNLN